jgi:ABC-2 type transport system permease protein
MNQWISALRVEVLKLRRSTLFWVSLASSILVPLTGLLASRRNPVPLDLPGFMDELGTVLSIGGLIGFGFIFSWIFGREYSDRTVKDLLALPLSRYGVAAAKIIVAAVWCIVLTVLMFAAAIIAARLVHLDGWSLAVIRQSFRESVMLSLMVICLCMPVAWVASIGRGYLSPLGFIVLTVVLSQLGSGMGIVEYIPWAIPSLLIGAAGEGGTQLQTLSRLLPAITGGIGIAGTLIWWRYANQT